MDVLEQSMATLDLIERNRSAIHDVERSNPEVARAHREVIEALENFVSAFNVGGWYG